MTRTVSVIGASLLRRCRRPFAAREYTASGKRKLETGGKPGHAIDDLHRDVRDGAEPVALGQDLLRDRDEPGSVDHEEPDRAHDVVPSAIFGKLEIEIEPRVLPLDEDEWIFLRGLV